MLKKLRLALAWIIVIPCLLVLAYAILPFLIIGAVLCAIVWAFNEVIEC